MTGSLSPLNTKFTRRRIVSRSASALAGAPSSPTTRTGIAMKHFLAVYVGSAAGMQAWKDLDEAERKQKETAGLQAWHAWMTAHAKSVVDMGGPLGKTK